MIGQKIKERRLLLGWTQQDLADRMGYKSKSTINKIELGLHDVSQSKVIQFADALGTTPAFLMGWTEVKGKAIPVYGRVAAGIPFEAITDIIGYEEIPDTLIGDYFALQVKGDSMSPRIADGDIVIVKQQSDAESGDVVVAQVNGEDATVKKLLKTESGVTLLPLNPAYDPIYRTDGVKILGKVVELRGRL